MEIPPLYTFKENCEEAPPTYDDYEKESWTTGPVEFIAPTSLKALVILYITVKCIASIGLTVVWMCLNQDQDQNGAVGIGVFYGCFGIWPWPLMTFYSRRHMTLARYKFSRFWYSWWTLLFIAETTFFLVLGPIGLILKYRVWIPFGGGIALAIANVLMFWICTHYECFNHEPLRRGAKHVLTDVCHAENTPFRFVATTAFRIVIKNVSNETVSGNFTVYRKTGEINRKSFILWIRAQFTLKLVDFAPGEQITCIPESHTLEGATVIPDFRSFGVDRSHVVKTAIYKGSRRDACDLRAQVTILTDCIRLSHK